MWFAVWSCDPVCQLRLQELYDRYSSFVDALGLRDGEAGKPYNLLVTRDWMMVVPRQAEDHEVAPSTARTTAKCGVSAGSPGTITGASCHLNGAHPKVHSCTAKNHKRPVVWGSRNVKCGTFYLCAGYPSLVAPTPES